ncbi:MAG: Lrp/AsnC family transcriptional regulator [Chloroflexota bacterium]
MSYEVQEPLDDLDWHILCLLQENARLTFAELGRLVGLTRPAVAERVRQLEEAGVITGYRAELDLRKVGLPMMAFIRIATSGEGKYDQMLALIKDRPEVLECHRVTGGDSYFVKMVVSSVEHLQEVLERLLPYGQPTTSIVLSSPVTNRIVGPPSAGRGRVDGAQPTRRRSRP